MTRNFFNFCFFFFDLLIIFFPSLDRVTRITGYARSFYEPTRLMNLSSKQEMNIRWRILNDTRPNDPV